jgi:hypothetical protein
VLLMESSILSEVDDTSILRAALSTPPSLSSRLVTDPSTYAPAQRAGAQRLCALARLGIHGHRPGRQLSGVHLPRRRCIGASMVGISTMGGYHISEQIMPLPESSSDDPPDTARPSVEQPEKPTL